MKKDEITSLLLYLQSYLKVYDKKNNQTYISSKISTDNPTHFYQIGSNSSSQFLKNILYNGINMLLQDRDIKELSDHLDFHCREDEKENVIHKRVAYIDGHIYINSGDDTIIKITEARAGYVTKSKAMFMVNPNIGAMVTPDLINGDLSLLHKHINVSDDLFKLIIVAILNSFFDNTPHVIIIITGEAGSAKSTTEKLLKTTMDPSPVILQDQFHEIKDLIIAALHSHVIDINNVSNLNDKMQNQMCTILTGGTSTSRGLYSNHDQVTIRLHNPIIINGIGNVVTRDDLLERAILVELKKISSSNRKTEEQVISAFNKDLPLIMGGIFNTLSDILKIKQSFKKPRQLNRMADFHLLGLMAEKALAWEKGSFTKAYNENIALVQGDVIDNSPIATALIELKNSNDLPFKGRYIDLIDVLKLKGNRGEITPRKLTNELQRLTFSLRKLHGIRIKKIGRAGQGSFILIDQVDK